MRNKVISLLELEAKVLESEMKSSLKKSKRITMDDFFQITIIKKSLIIL